MANIPHDTMTPATQNLGATKKIIMITGDKVEDLEFYYPYYRFIEEGFQVDVATIDGGKFKAKNGYVFEEAIRLDSVNPDEYDLLFLPGGKAPASLMKNEGVLAFVRSFKQSGRPIAAICHGPQILAAADVIRGAMIAAWPEVREEVENAGATYVSKEAEADGQFITARWPADLPMHLKRVFEVLGHAPHMTAPLTKGGQGREPWIAV